jgi:hypothetical protein
MARIAAAIPVGCAITLLGSMLRLLRCRLMPVLAVLAVLASVTLVLYFATPVLKAIGNWNLAFFFLALLAAGVLLGVPIGFAFATATVAFLICVTHAPLAIVISRMNEGMSSLVLLAVPVRVSRSADRDDRHGARDGGLPCRASGVCARLAVLCAAGAMYLVSGISGSKAADVAAVAPVLFPELRQRGSNDGEMISILSASGETDDRRT